jgi:hypothetical protein
MNQSAQEIAYMKFKATDSFEGISVGKIHRISERRCCYMFPLFARLSFFYPDMKGVKIKMNMERWWSNIDRRKQNY